MDTEQVLAYWAACMKVEDLTERSIQERMIFFRRLARELGDFKTITRAELIHWIAGKDWANATRVNYRSTLHIFFTWYQDENFRLDNPAARLPKVKHRKADPNPFTVDEINDLLASGIYAKTRAMVALHYYLGLRVAEISRVHGHDIDWKYRTLTTIGKGVKKVVMPVPEAAWPIFDTMPRAGYWFPNRATNRLFEAGEGHVLSGSVSTLLCDAIKRAGLKHRAHDLRAATATELNRANVSAFAIQKGMRHTQMDTTNRYLVVDLDQVRTGLNQLPAVRMPERSGRKRAA
ncbi:tyrosine-type recombinase/integrase [Arthrobacter sp. HLT1-20]